MAGFTHTNLCVIFSHKLAQIYTRISLWIISTPIESILILLAPIFYVKGVNRIIIGFNGCFLLMQPVALTSKRGKHKIKHRKFLFVWFVKFVAGFTHTNLCVIFSHKSAQLFMVFFYTLFNPIKKTLSPIFIIWLL